MALAGALVQLAILSPTICASKRALALRTSVCYDAWKLLVRSQPTPEIRFQFHKNCRTPSRLQALPWSRNNPGYLKCLVSDEQSLASRAGSALSRTLLGQRPATFQAMKKTNSCELLVFLAVQLLEASSEESRKGAISAGRWSNARAGIPSTQIVRSLKPGPDMRRHQEAFRTPWGGLNHTQEAGRLASPKPRPSAVKPSPYAPDPQLKRLRQTGLRAQCSGKGLLQLRSLLRHGLLGKKWGFPKIRSTLLGVPIIRILLLGSTLGSPYFGKLPNVRVGLLIQVAEP